MSEETRTPVLLFTHETNRGTLSDGQPLLLLRFTAHYLNAGRQLRNFNSGGYDAEPLADLSISAQADDDHPYGYRTEYRDVFSVDQRRADAMLKTLRRVDRGLTRLQSTFGPPESFAAYAARVANVLGIDAFGHKHRTGGMFYDDNDYRWTDADGISAHVAGVLHEFHKDRERVPA